MITFLIFTIHSDYDNNSRRIRGRQHIPVCEFFHNHKPPHKCNGRYYKPCDPILQLRLKTSKWFSQAWRHRTIQGFSSHYTVQLQKIALGSSGSISIEYNVKSTPWNCAVPCAILFSSLLDSHKFSYTN